MDNSKYLIITGARQHNLKNINVKIPRDKMVAITGLSGSGKSSLAIDTIYAEGKRRFLQSLSTYARQFLGSIDKPDVDSIEGLSPAIAITQMGLSSNPRSIVGTVTEIYDYLRLLYANIGIPHCPICGNKIIPRSSQEITKEILESLKEGTKFKVRAPVISGKKGTYEKLFKKLHKEGYSRVIIQDEGHDAVEHLLDNPINLDKFKKHSIDVVIDRLIMREDNSDFKSRTANAIETALILSEGIVKITIIDGGATKIFSEHHFCSDCGISYSKLLPRDFSFNTPYGNCKYCKGLGSVLSFNEDNLFPNRSNPITESNLTNVGGFRSLNGYSWKMIESVFDHYNVSLATPMNEYPDNYLEKLLYGTGKDKIKFEINGDRPSDDNGFSDDGKMSFSWKVRRPFEGILTTLQRRYMQTSSDGVRKHYENFMKEYVCNHCKGQRLKPETLAVVIKEMNIWDICRMTVDVAIKWFKKLKLSKREGLIVKQVLKEINSRYSFLENVGLDYISLDRLSKTLSGGESERIRLATQIGSNLVGVLYVLDEPTIGLHSRDKFKLINMLKELRNKGNSVLIVEHDEDVIREADFIVDIGPGAGMSGGEVVATGSVEDIIASPRSITGKYLSGEYKIEIPKHRRFTEKGWIKIYGARENNLKNIDVEIPLGVFTCITGVSGAGKSSLVENVLVTAIKNSLSRKSSKKYESNYDKIEGLEDIDKMINIDQSPIGRTPRSVPSTYTKVFDVIRDVFAQTEEAKIRGYDKGRFSFNVKRGRCQKCGGKGFNLIEMHFLPDVYVKCDVCKGKRYNEETLEVKYNDKSIYEVLMMTHNQALEFFKHHPKIRQILKTVVDVGLGYIALGQSSTTLSGGEAQRMKLSRELSKRSTGNTLYILDEPTTGLHFHDIKVLIKALQFLVDKKNTVVIIEHNFDIIKSADYIIDLGPEGGEKGGYIVTQGTPEEVASHESSYTGKFLYDALNNIKN